MTTPSAATMSQWQVVWLKAVAKAWKDKKFETELKKDPHKALKSAFNFEIPAGVKLALKTATRGGTQSFEATHATGSVPMELPPKPADDEQAVALANLAEETAKHCCGQPCC
jgi:ribosomally synthesized peptide (two-chain TOMM family)